MTEKEKKGFSPMIISAFFSKDDSKIVRKVVKLINDSLDYTSSPFFDHSRITVSSMKCNLIKLSIVCKAKDNSDPAYKLADERFNYDIAYIDGYINGVKSIVNEKK
jgi:hypothetical protein